MSGALGFVGGFGIAAGLATLESILFNATRVLVPSAGRPIVPNVVLEEHTSDRLEITRHPVEYGASTADHAFKEPTSVTMTLGWTNSTIFALGSEQYVRLVYNDLLTLQASRKPLLIVTPKRLYPSMLVEELSLTSDATSEYALMVNATFQQILIVETQAATVPPQANQAKPSSTSSVNNQGANSPVPTPQPSNSSLLNQIFGGP